MTIQAIIWDMGGVLLHMGDENPRRALEQAYGIPLKKFYWAIFDSPSAQEATVGKLSVIAHWQYVGEYLGIPEGSLSEFLEQFWSTDHIDQPMVDFIHLLRKNYKIGLLSNAWDNLHELIRNTWQIEDAFHDLVISAEVGLAKPDPKIYQLAVKRLGVYPDEAVFIDDFKDNVLAAREAGLNTIHYKNRTQVLRQLQKILTTNGRGLSAESLIAVDELASTPYPTPLDPSYLAHLQVSLEYGLDPDRRLVPFPGSDEQARLIIYRTAQKDLHYYHFKISQEARQSIINLSLDKVFPTAQEILEAMQQIGHHKQFDPFNSYYFDHTPSPAEFPDVCENNGRFEILNDREPVAWAWSVRENKRCAEVAVETLPAYRRRGYARQVTSAWARSVIQDGRVAFFSHKYENLASRGLANSLGIVQFAESMAFG